MSYTTQVSFGFFLEWNGHGLHRITTHRRRSNGLGAFGVGPMADLTVVGSTLYGWQSAGTHDMYSINTATGVATIVGGGSGNPGYGGGGLATNAGGTVYVSPNAIFPTPPGNLYTVN